MDRLKRAARSKDRVNFGPPLLSLSLSRWNLQFRACIRIKESILKLFFLTIISFERDFVNTTHGRIMKH